MADYFTHFSCIFDVGSAENAQRAFAIRNEIEAERDRRDAASLGFMMRLDESQGPGALWIFNDDYGEPQDVIAFVLECAEAFDLQGHWEFRWALTCSRPRLDGFGGGAQIIDLSNRTSIASVDCEQWVTEQIALSEGPVSKIEDLAASPTEAGQ